MRVAYSFFLFFFFAVPIHDVFSLSASYDFGKTHFIRGFSNDLEVITRTPKRESVVLPAPTQVFFSPDDSIQDRMISFIDNERESIRVAVFIFTNQKIADALIRAKKRGVLVEIIVDPSHMKDRYSKIPLIKKNGIAVFEYNPDYIRDKRSNIMHHKFIIFGTAVAPSSCVWTGSFNFTQSADQRNQENVVVVFDRESIEKFLNQYAVLKQRCV